jgi:AcrR family transcriptional regulator
VSQTTVGVAAEPAKGGRPLDSSRDSAILNAALELICEVGYERVTMDAIASRSHASKATMYRRWDCKATLVAEAIRERRPEGALIPDTGDVRSDLIAGLRSMVEYANKADLQLFGGLMTVCQTDPQLALLLREQMVTDKRNAMASWTQRCIELGVLPAGTNVDLLYEIAPAVVFMRLLFTGEPVDEDFLFHLVDDILLPLLTR